MMVSVVIPTYNRADVIGEAIASSLGQTYGDLESIVVDDGSSDGTQSVVARFEDKRLRYVRHDRNRGCGAAYNTGFRESRGDLIAILDSDDLWKAEKLERQVSFMVRNPAADAVFTDAEKEDSGTHTPSFLVEAPYFLHLFEEVGRAYEVTFTEEQMFLCLLSEVPIKMPTLMIRRKVLDGMEWLNESWPSGNDWEFLLRCAKIFRFGFINERLAVIRVRGDATHRAHYELDKQLMLGCLRQHMAQAAGDTQAFAAARHGISELTKHLAWHYQSTGRPLAAVGVCLKAYRDTRQPEALARAAISILPNDVVSILKKVFGH